eukprot:TRINITY_DN13173_c0_g1_i2.p1 TRINITY_DN13173_c0_g1~~TRINITY_DN13173_c0_g1_i2.p1  ORF type:complete len:642 (+),score=119.44 TRINITY_DN13173_c0_g1_i2:431-2356(+)
MKNSQAPGNLYYDPHALIRSSDGSQRLEALSQRLLLPGLQCPGKVTWMPEEADPKGTGSQFCQIIGLRVMRGEEQDHITGALYKYVGGSGFVWRCKAFTGQVPLFWIELLLLTCSMFYLDWVLDIKQLKLFYQSSMRMYLAANAIGILLPIAVTWYDIILWVRESPASAELDALRSLIKPYSVLVVLIACITSQSFVLVLTLLSCRFRKKHVLLSGAKYAEVVEAGTSLLVQMNFLLSLIFGVKQMDNLHLSTEELQSLAISVAVSCASLGLSFAGRDQADTRILRVPGKLKGWQPTMVLLFFVRILEVASRVCTVNLLHLSTRSSYSVGGPLAAALTCLSAKLAFPKAGPSEIFAALFAHPGQILEPASQLPLWKSSCISWMLVAAAALAQYRLHVDEAAYLELFSHAKPGPPALLLAWLATYACSQVGLYAFWRFGHMLQHPIVDELGMKLPDEEVLMPSTETNMQQVPRRSFAYSEVATTFDSKVVPAAFLEICAKNGHVLTLDKIMLDALFEDRVRAIQGSLPHEALQEAMIPKADQEGETIEDSTIPSSFVDLAASQALVDVDLTGASFPQADKSTWGRPPDASLQSSSRPAGSCSRLFGSRCVSACMAAARGCCWLEVSEEGERLWMLQSSWSWS